MLWEKNAEHLQLLSDDVFNKTAQQMKQNQLHVNERKRENGF